MLSLIIYIYIYIYIQVSWPTIFEGDMKALFSIATTLRFRGGHYSFPWIAPLTLDQRLIMLSVKQGHIKHNFLSLLCDSYIYIYIYIYIYLYCVYIYIYITYAKFDIYAPLLILSIVYLQINPTRLLISIYIYVCVYVCVCVCVCVI